MPTPHKVRRNYTRDRSKFTAVEQVRPVRVVIYVRPDQFAWMVAETLRRTGKAPTVGRGSKLGEIAREGIDLAIEFADHKEFMRAKAARALVAEAPPARSPIRSPSEPGAKSQESAAPGQPSCDTGGQSE